MITFDIDWFAVLQLAFTIIGFLSFAASFTMFFVAFEADHPVLCAIVSVFLALLGIASFVVLGSMKKI